MAVARCAYRALVLVMLLARPAHAQEVLLRHYTVDDGLANDTVGHAFQDRSGYLWFSTAEGLSRFDGYDFVTYTIANGLAGNTIHQVAEAPDGSLWIGTNRGLSRLVDSPGPAAFSTHRGASPVAAFSVASDGRLWCIQSDGIYTAQSAPQPTFVRVRQHTSSAVESSTFIDRQGVLWLSHDATLFEVRGEQLIEHPQPDTRAAITGIAQQPDGTLLVTRGAELFRFRPRAGDRGDEWTLVMTGLPNVTALFADTRGYVWLGRSDGLARVDTSTRTISRVTGTSGTVSDVVEDRDGNLWVTSLERGVFKIPAEFILSYTEADGLRDTNIASVVEGDGRIYVVTQRGGIFEIRDRGAVFMDGSAQYPFNTIRRRLVHDGNGRWWMWTDAGAFVIDGALDVRRAVPVADVGPPFPSDADGPALYVAPDRGVWIATADRRVLRGTSGQKGTLAMVAGWDASIGPAGRIALTSGGSLWLGMHLHVARLAGGALRRFGRADGLPDTPGRALFVDSRGWLWVGHTADGVTVTENPDALQPVFRNYSMREGLSSSWVSWITEDGRGRMYFVTGRGLDRFDPRTGHFRRLSRADGLVDAKVTYCLRDSHGDIWVGTTHGVSRIVMRDAPPAQRPPEVILSGVRIGERDIPMPVRGSRSPLALDLSGSGDSVRIDYVALNFLGENTLRYRFKLDGAVSDWTGPTDARSVIYANLAPGSYTFRVSAVGPNGDVGPETTTLSFTVPPPVWQRWWFLLAIGTAIAMAAASLHRLRVNRLLEMERVRRQVSNDLHDDLGAGLVHIAAMGELAAVDPNAHPHIWRDISALARALRDSMSDIVWAVDPSFDRFGDVVQRMKDVAYAMLEADGITVEFRAPDRTSIDRTVMTTAYRRHLLLILKESVANIVRHASASQVAIDVIKESRVLRVVIRDDGVGFDPRQPPTGNGLPSIRRRAAAIGGRLDVESSPGHGTTVSLTLTV